jgi:hypothetical protein
MCLSLHGGVASAAPALLILLARTRLNARGVNVVFPVQALNRMCMENQHGEANDSFGDFWMRDGGDRLRERCGRRCAVRADGRAPHA